MRQKSPTPHRSLRLGLACDSDNTSKLFMSLPPPPDPQLAPKVHRKDHHEVTGPAVILRSSKNRWVRDSSEFSRLTALGTVREGDETWPGDRHLLPLKSTCGNYCHQHAQPSLSRPRMWQSPGSLLELQRPNLHFSKTQGDSFTRSLKPG